MRIISLLGSPHGLKGNTGRLLQRVLEGAGAEGAKIEIEVLKGNYEFQYWENRRE